MRTNSDGTMSWTTLSGRDYVTYRHPYDDPLSKPVNDAEVKSADVELPPPF